VAWLLNHYAQPPSRPGGTRHYELARHAADHGWDVHVIAASTELVSGSQTVTGAHRSRWSRAGEVSFTWVKAPSYHGNGIARYANMSAFALNAWVPGALRHLPEPDAIIGSSVHPLTALAAWRLAQRHHVPFVFEVRDLWPETLVAFGAVSEGSVTERGISQLVGHLYRSADRVITTMPRGVECVAGYGVPRTKVTWIPNGVDFRNFPKPPPPPPRDFVHLVYVGAHGQANGLEILLDAMDRVRHLDTCAPIHLTLVGDGPLKPALMRRSVELGLRDSVSFRAPVPHSDVPALTAEADALVFVSLDLPQLYRFGMSTNKMSDYLASGRPILAALDFDDDPVSVAEAGIVVPPDASSLARGMVAIAQMGESERATCGASGRRFAVRNLDFARLGHDLATLLDDVVGARSAPS